MKHKGTKNLAILLALALLFALVPGMSGTAYADSGSDYTFSIPSSLTVQNAGENAAGNISVTALTANKKLTVSAASSNGWALKSGDNSVGYSMSKTSWEFTAAGSEAFSITVEDYSAKPAGTYQDTVTFTASVENAAQANPYADNDIGDVVTFGSYSWYIIGKSDNGVTLLMQNNLENKKYNDSWGVTWETCSLRTYLNGDFYNSFSPEDKAKIVGTRNTNPNNPAYNTSGGNDTYDYIYLLSIAEANSLNSSIRNIGSSWWLRSPGYDSDTAAIVDSGNVNTLGMNVLWEYGVRPTLNLEF